VLKEKLGQKLDDWVPRLLPFVFSQRLSPSAMTVTGTLICLAAAVQFGRGAFLSGGLLLGAGGIFDLLDGMVARRNGSESLWGAFLDSTLDRLVDMSVMVGLMFHYALAGEPMWVALGGFVLIASVMTSYVKARAETLGSAIGKGVFERGERIVLLILGGLTGWMIPILGILAVGGLVTASQRMLLAYHALAKPEPEPKHAGGH
jgi:phosphatidylglycerophosphate synthase